MGQTPVICKPSRGNPLPDNPSRVLQTEGPGCPLLPKSGLASWTLLRLPEDSADRTSLGISASVLPKSMGCTVPQPKTNCKRLCLAPWGGAPTGPIAVLVWSRGVCDSLSSPLPPQNIGVRTKHARICRPRVCRRTYRISICPSQCSWASASRMSLVETPTFFAANLTSGPQTGPRDAGANCTPLSICLLTNCTAFLLAFICSPNHC